MQATTAAPLRALACVSASRGPGRLKTIFAAAGMAVSLLLAGGQAAEANPRYAALVVDAIDGDVLFKAYAEEERFPASLSKMMTLYILFEEIEAGRLSMESALSVSSFAASIPPSKLGVKAGETLAVEEAIYALAVKSANDVAVVVAENLEGTVAAFGRRMTRTAKAIGMEDTNFVNPHGLPDSEQVTTARDMAVLGMSLHDRFPEQFKVFSTRSHLYGETVLRNTNGLLGLVEGMEGIKTGYTRASGFNLVTSVKRDGRHIIAVVMGGRSGASRNAHMRELIEAHLPKATPGERKTPLLVADTSGVNSAPLPRERPVPPALVADAGEESPDAATIEQATASSGEPTEEMGDTALGYAPTERPASEPVRAIDGVVQDR
jgi:D-alanyl-D-alanine carboxypeptidase